MKNLRPLLVFGLACLSWGTGALADDPRQAWHTMLVCWKARLASKSHRSPKTFEQAVQQVYAQNPHLRLQQNPGVQQDQLAQEVALLQGNGAVEQGSGVQQPTDDTTTTSLYQSASNATDVAAAIYLFARVLAAYHAVYGIGGIPQSATQEGVLQKTIGTFVVWAAPTAIYNTYKLTCFLTAITTSGLETVLYKSVAKFMLFCCRADLGDLADVAIKRVKKFYCL